jgi:hypothetical protein
MMSGSTPALDASGQDEPESTAPGDSALASSDQDSALWFIRTSAKIAAQIPLGFWPLERLGFWLNPLI